MNAVAVDTVFMFVVLIEFQPCFFKLYILGIVGLINCLFCAVIIFCIVLWETDSLRFMRLHNCWIIKQFWDIQKELHGINKMETPLDVFHF